jgi:hypothetical protein
MLGRTHSDKTPKKMSSARFLSKGMENPSYFKTACGENNPMFKQQKPAGSGTPSLFFFLAIEVFDNKTNQTTNFESILEAARACPASLLRRAKYS